MSLPKSVTAMLAITYETQQVLDVIFKGDTPEKDKFINGIAGLVALDFPQSLGDVNYFDEHGDLIEKPTIKLNLVGSVEDFEAYSNKYDKAEDLEADLRLEMEDDARAELEAEEDSE